jgi:hypothetical protein
MDVVWPRFSRPSCAPDCQGATLTRYTPEQVERLRQIHMRVIEARRELDALIGDAYLRPRASIVPVHFLDLASAVEKLRWAEKEWRELDDEMREAPESAASALAEDEEEPEEPAQLLQIVRD